MFSFGVLSMLTRRSLLPQHKAMAVASFLFLIILAAAAAAGVSSIDGASEISNGSCIPAERAALLSFKAGIWLDRANRLATWQQEHYDCCRWSGVTCSSRTGHVVKLDLRNDYPAEFDELIGVKGLHSLRGQVSSSLLALRRSLRYLDLSGNIFLGDKMAMPGFLGSLRSLRYLNLSDMGFQGIVPPQLGNLSKLVQFDIQCNLQRGLYSEDISWVARLRSLEHLNMASIYLSRVTHWEHTVNALSNLVVLILSDCMLNTPSSVLHHNLTALEELDLSGNSFTSPSAANWFWDVTSLKSLRLRGCGLSGMFPDDLGNLTLLETFDISSNNIKGMIPGTLQNLCNLKSLSLGYNNIGGDIRDVIEGIPNCSWKNLQKLELTSANIGGTTLRYVSNLTSLNMLDVSYNQLSGLVPAEIAMLTKLTYLDLGNNNLSGTVPVEIGMLTSLTSLDLTNNNLTGSLPVEISTLINLSELYLGNNKLSGSLPVDISQLIQLSVLYLKSNNLSGVISEDHFAGLLNLESIDLSYNNLEFNIDSRWVPPFTLFTASFSSCHLGPQFPKWLRWLKATDTLDLSNTGLVGRIPYWFWIAFSDTQYLDISLNQLSGELPLSLEFMSVTELSMQSNLLTGLIPKLPKTIGVLDISRNSLDGFVPNFRAPKLEIVDLFSNSITGTIPAAICQMQKLRFLDISNNMLSAELPDCGKEMKKWNLSRNKSPGVNFTVSFGLEITTLLLRNNSLSSGFPLFLRHCRSLIFLDLAQNKFTGELPRWISEAMPGLVMLMLRSNNFSGHIPIEIVKLQSVRILDLSNNNFSGAIPQYLGKMKALTSANETSANIDNGADFQNPFEELYLGQPMEFAVLSDDSFSVVIKGQVLKYRENTVYLMNIDLSCNSLTGEIPEEVISLVALVNLNLSSNLLSGYIPYKIGNIRSLESLDLSKNKLGGRIPQSLSDMTYLSYMNLSYNNLSGRIPSGHQLDSLNTDDPASMYIGNPGLCGYPIPRQCSYTPRDLPTNEDSAIWHEDGLSQMDFLLGSIIGFVAGVWMVFCGLLLMKRWRYAYFGLLDKLYDMLYVIFVVTWRKWFNNTGVY